MIPLVLVIVSGLPASGKTTLARRLAADLQLPLISRDEIKERLFDSLGWNDRAWSRRLGAASWSLVYWAIEAQLAAQRSCIIESNFDPKRDSTRIASLGEKFTCRTIQIHCYAAGNVLVERYQWRVAAGERHPGHVDGVTIDEYRDRLLAATPQPLAIGGPLLLIDTTDPSSIDYDWLVAEVRSMMAGGRVNIRGLIFDFDGTLADTIPLCVAAFREVALRQVGRDYTDDKIIALFGPSEDGIFQQIAGDDWEACLEEFLHIYEREHDRCASLFPGILDMLDVLNDQQIKVAIVTGKGARSAAISLRQFGLDKHFDIVESGSPEGSIKPAAIRRIVQHWNLDPAIVAYVGDAPNDITEAYEAGVVPLAAAWAATADRAALEARDPARLFASVAELTGWIRHNIDE